MRRAQTLRPILRAPWCRLMAMAGGPGFTLTVQGEDFVPDSMVKWNGDVRPTLFVSPNQLTATIPATDILPAGTASVTVVNPGPGGDESNSDSYEITAPLLLTSFTLMQAGSSASAPWNGAGTAYGTVRLQSTGTTTGSNVTQTTNETETYSLALPVNGALGNCEWSGASYPPPPGGMADAASVNNQVVSTVQPDSGCNVTWVGSGKGASGVSDLMVISPDFDTYTFASDDLLTTTTTYSGQCDALSAQTQLLETGPQELPTTPIPLPSNASVLSGSVNFSSTPEDRVIPANWTLTWNFSPVPDDTPSQPCDDPNGSRVGCQRQSLGEDTPIAGTGFFLHYESDRALGRAGADAAAINDARNLGGWTLSVHHALEPLLTTYCAGGGCTPYAKVPKVLFLGNGGSREDFKVQAPVSLNGNLYLTSEDGSKVYVFSNGLHTQTLRPMTGAVRYTLGYDANGRLVSVADANGNATTIQRDSNGNPTEITSPHGQVTTLAVDANGYLSQVTDPAGNTFKLSSGSTGLLASLTDPNGNTYSFQYDGFGRLIKDADPAGGAISLARTDSAPNYSVAETTASGVTRAYQVGLASTTSQTTQQYTNTWSNGLQASGSDTQQSGQLTESTTLPDGTSFSTTLGPDPRWGIQAPVPASTTVRRGSLTMATSGSPHSRSGHCWQPVQPDEPNPNRIDKRSDLHLHVRGAEPDVHDDEPGGPDRHGRTGFTGKSFKCAGPGPSSHPILLRQPGTTGDRHSGPAYRNFRLRRQWFSGWRRRPLEPEHQLHPRCGRASAHPHPPGRPGDQLQLRC